MQDASFDASDYGKAARGGILMQNDWTEPELNLQPHALHMHGAAGGAWRRALYCCECFYPGCHAKFDNQSELDTHTQVHSSNFGPHYGGSIGYHGDLHQPGPFPHDQRGTGPLCNYGLPTSGIAPGMVPGMVPSMPSGFFEGTAQSGFPSTAKPYYYDVPPQDIDAVAYSTSAPFTHNVTPYTTTTSNIPAEAELPQSLQPSNHYACAICGQTCARRGDLRRHELKHKTGNKAFECPKPGCVRKGTLGFERKDKIESHAKVCQGGARGKYRV
ncbi:MAG: hypothetical protein Q9216_002021 [Gyalolechia sp. 2 TL-2023]